jgi:hypothetical protein
LRAIAAKRGGTVSHVTVRSILANPDTGTGRGLRANSPPCRLYAGGGHDLPLPAPVRNAILGRENAGIWRMSANLRRRRGNGWFLDLDGSRVISITTEEGKMTLPGFTAERALIAMRATYLMNSSPKSQDKPDVQPQLASQVRCVSVGGDLWCKIRGVWRLMSATV